MPTLRACIVGTGNIAQAHAEAIKDITLAELTAVVDVDASRAQSFADKWGVPNVYSDLKSALKDDKFDVVHVTTPPDLHTQISLEAIERGKQVFTEKPISTTVEEAEKIIEAGNANNVVVGVNQNFVYHPAFLKLRNVITSNSIGKVRHVTCHYYMPLRQMDAQQFGHWMFQEPVNLFLEQAVHPLSQIRSIIGALTLGSTNSKKGDDLVQGVPFYESVQLNLNGANATATMAYALGHSYPTWRIEALCDDGVVTADVIANRCTIERHGAALEFLDTCQQGLMQAGSTVWQSLSGLGSYMASLFKIKGRSDPFYLSMKESISSYYSALKNGNTPLVDGEFGKNLVQVCEQLSAHLSPDWVKGQTSELAETAEGCDIVVLGGSGFIGLPTVHRCRKAGLKVALMARSVDHLLKNKDLQDVAILRGSVTNPEDVTRAVKGVPLVINLAHGGGGESFEAIRRALVGSAETVAKICLEHNVKRLVHVGSIAGLYLGDPNDVVTGQTPPDKQLEERADYARAKAEADLSLLAMHKKDKLPVTIVRPGVVVGKNGSPLHSAIGFANTEQHWFGWNDGNNALPFVLVEDVADALYKAATVEGIDGRCFNLASDGVDISARRWMSEVAARLQRPIKYHPSLIRRLWLEEIGKWLVKKLVGRQAAPPSMRDFNSRAMLARLDCSDSCDVLGWSPEQDTASFLDRSLPPRP